MSGDNTLQAAVAEMQKAAAELRGDGAYSRGFNFPLPQQAAVLMDQGD